MRRLLRSGRDSRGRFRRTRLGVALAGGEQCDWKGDHVLERQVNRDGQRLSTSEDVVQGLGHPAHPTRSVGASGDRSRGFLLGRTHWNGRPTSAPARQRTPPRLPDGCARLAVFRAGAAIEPQWTRTISRDTGGPGSASSSARPGRAGAPRSASRWRAIRASQLDQARARAARTRGAWRTALAITLATRSTSSRLRLVPVGRVITWSHRSSVTGRSQRRPDSSER